MLQASYTPQAWEAQLLHPEDRSIIASHLEDKVGGRLESWYLTFGEYDVVLIAEVPDSIAAAAVSMAAYASGVLRSIKTTPLLTPQEGIAAMRKAAPAEPIVRPPGT